MLSAAAGAGPSPGPFPTTIDVELATLVAQAPEGDGWLSEVKYDGYRLVLALDGGRARALTRSHADWTDRFSPLAAAAEALPASSAILDGEAIVFDEAGVSRFELLQKALGEHPERLAFAAFDLLYLNGYDLRELPLLKRKELLAELLTGQPETFPLHFADHLTSGSAEFYRRACVSDLEGIVCKLAGSRYTPGRGRDWQKVKCRQTQEFVVGGFTEGAGSRSALGSLLIGHYEGDVLVYAGRVGSGLDAAAVTALRSKLEEIERDSSPFDPPPHITGHVVHWAQPTLVVQVAFREWTSEGVLRQPVYLGIREDKAAEEVVREAPGEGSAPGGDSDDAGDPGAGDPPSGDAVTPGARDAGSPVEVLGVKVTNPDKLLFPESGFTKLDFARYYKAIAPLMLSEVADRPLTLVRCPVGRGRGCFYQRHPDAGLPAQVRRLPYTLKSEAVELLYVDSADGLVALAQMGAAEIHTWLSHTDAPARPDRLCFDLDPGPDVSWPQIRATALLVREECSALGFAPFVKSTGSKGLHVVIPIEPVWEFDRIRALAKLIAERIASRHPESLTSKMAKNVRGGRVFFDYLRNAEGASAVAPYSTRMKPGPSCAVPLGWDELAEDLDIRGFTPARVLERMSAGVDPWRDMGDSAVGVRVLRKAEESVGGV
jgi:bifunctional non-homologous end joining protein LigD